LTGNVSADFIAGGVSDLRFPQVTTALARYNTGGQPARAFSSHSTGSLEKQPGPFDTRSVASMNNEENRSKLQIIQRFSPFSPGIIYGKWWFAASMNRHISTKTS
jgi:hypothetical protein